MAEYIEREAAEKILYDGCHTSNGRECPDDVVELWHMVQAIPAADVVPVRHGRWLLIEYPYGQKTYLCSECKDDSWWNGRYAYGDELYCPNCGAKMDGEA